MGVLQERMGLPLTCTVQAPQSAMPQPNLVPVSFSSSRSTQSNGVSGSTSSNNRSCPLIIIFIAVASSFLLVADVIPESTSLEYGGNGRSSASGVNIKHLFETTAGHTKGGSIACRTRLIWLRKQS